MNDKQKELSRCFILIDLLIQEIDEIKDKKLDNTIVLMERLNLAQQSLIELFEDVYNKSAINKTNFFQTIQQKLNYNLDKESKKYLKK